MDIRFTGKRNLWMVMGAAIFFCMVSAHSMAQADHVDYPSVTSQEVLESYNAEDVMETLSAAPGADASQMIFTWYSREQGITAEIRISENEHMTDSWGIDGDSSGETKMDGKTYYVNRTIVKGLKPETTYWVQAKIDGEWSQAQRVRTASPYAVSSIATHSCAF